MQGKRHLPFTIYDLRFTIYDLRFTIWEVRARCAGCGAGADGMSWSHARMWLQSGGRRWRLTPPMYDLRWTMYDLDYSAPGAREFGNPSGKRIRKCVCYVRFINILIRINDDISQ